MIFLRTVKWLEKKQNENQQQNDQHHIEEVMQKGSTYPENGVSISSDYTLYLKGKDTAAQIPSNREYSIHASGSVYDLDQLIQQSVPARFEQDVDY